MGRFQTKREVLLQMVSRLIDERDTKRRTLLLSYLMFLFSDTPKSGNFHSDNPSSGADNTAEVYTPTTGMWSMTGSLTTARQDHTATLLPSGKVLVAGGWGGWTSGQGIFATAELYTPKTGT